jgi:tetratricopeptide (TPR) repeat protein/predicted aspartyl protease
MGLLYYFAMNSRFLLAIALSTSVWSQNTVTADNTKAPAASGPASTVSATADPLAAAKDLLKERKFEEAATAFRTIVANTPDMAEAHAGLLKSLVRAGKLEEAQDAAKQATAALPQSALIQAAAGDVAFRAAHFSDAEKNYRTAVKLDPGSARGWFGIARISKMVSMRRQAQSIFAKAHELDPRDEQIYDAWVNSLPRSQELDAWKKHAGDHPGYREDNIIKVLTETAQKEPWVLASGIKPSEIKMALVGRKLDATNDVGGITSNGPIHVANGFGLQVKFNDRASATLLLDSGADGITIGNKLAEKVGVKKIADSAFGGIGDKGPVLGYIGWVDKIKIGDVEFHNCIVEVSSRNDVAEEAGLIGTNVFDKFLITLDFRERKLLLAPLPANPAVSAELAGNDNAPQDRYIAPEMQSYTKVFLLDNHIFVPVVVNDKAIGTFILDTGAEINSLTPGFAAQVTKASNDHEYTMHGVSGRVNQVLTGKKAILQIAKMRIESHELPVFSVDNQSNSFGIEIAGFIGIRTLSQMKMTIDYRDGLINLEVYEFKKAQE